jgi:hypothetical protein
VPLHREQRDSMYANFSTWHQELLDEAKNKAIATRHFSDGLAVLFYPTIELALNVAARRSEANFRVRACLKRFKPTEWAEDKDHVWASYAGIERKSSSRLKSELHEIVDSIMQKSLTPKMVCESLGITASERLRMTREGKLAREGQGMFSADGRKGYFSMYSANCVRSNLIET